MWSRFDLVARFYRLKKKLLGLDELFDYDRYAPIEQTDTRYSWEEASQIVLRAYGEFHPEMSAIASRFFERSWIDAPVHPGKRPPTLGEHTEAILAELGRDAGEIAALRDQGVI